MIEGGPRRRVFFVALGGVVSLVASCSFVASCATAEPAAVALQLDSGTGLDTALIERVCSTPEWRGLYSEFFGNTGNAGSCAFNATCHGTPEGDGARSGSGIECYSERGCCSSMFIKGLVKPENAGSPEKSPLISAVLRRKTEDGGFTGIMPREPSDYAYSDESIERIKAWIRLFDTKGVADASSTPRD